MRHTVYITFYLLTIPVLAVVIPIVICITLAQGVIFHMRKNRHVR